MAGQKLSRRKIAAHVADEILAGKNVFDQLAAYLIEENRVREAELIVRDIEQALADRGGLVVADLDSAQPLDSDSKSAVADYLVKKINADRIVWRENVDPSLLGGVRVSAAGQELDSTLRRRLNLLKASKI